MTSICNSTVNCPLVFACDQDYAMPLATTLRSVAETNRSEWPLQIYLVSHGFSERTKTKIIDSLPKGSCSIRWEPVDLARFRGFSTLRHISRTTYARLLIPSILPAGIPRSLYLDADLLVLDSLRTICDLDLEGAALGAVVDERLDTYGKMGNTSLAGLPFPRVRDYFNAGALLIDLARWRAERISEKALEYLEQCPNSAYSDQDALNVACDGLWKKLDPRWNYYQIDLKEPVSDLSDNQRPGIIHFHGWSKPWDPGSLNFNARFYDGFRNRTLFALTLGERWRQGPTVIWARLKSILRRSDAVRHLWNRLKSLYA
jgi:lipopolysaccharide biosynthesis glycosyltransferase